VLARPGVQLVFGKILLAERIEDLDGSDRNLWPQDCIEQVNEDVRIPLAAINPLEGIDFWIGSQCHAGPPLSCGLPTCENFTAEAEMFFPKQNHV
jgi:hypothetical protein